MSAEFDRFTKALNATKTSEGTERDKQKQLEAEKQKIIAANRKKLEDSGVFKLFEEIIRNGIVKDGSIETGIKYTNDFFVSLIFNRKPNGEHDFCTIIASSFCQIGESRKLNECSSYIKGAGFTISSENRCYDGKSTHESHDEVNKKFNKTVPFDVEGYVAEKITNPDQFIIYKDCPYYES